MILPERSSEVSSIELSQRRTTFDAENHQENKRKTLRVSGVGFLLLREMTVSVHN